MSVARVTLHSAVQAGIHFALVSRRRIRCVPWRGYLLLLEGFKARSLPLLRPQELQVDLKSMKFMDATTEADPTVHMDIHHGGRSTNAIRNRI